MTLGAAIAILACAPSPATVSSTAKDPAPIRVRVATFNASLFRAQAGQLRTDLAADDAQAHAIAETIQRVAPDILLLAEIDEDPAALALFREQYLAVPHGDAPALVLDHAMQPLCNTGVQSGRDLDNDGELGTPGDAWGYGAYPGQYCFAVLSRWPIVHDAIRTFALLRWAQMRNHAMPVGFYPPDVATELRLSSKNHVDVPIDIDGALLHVLAHHPTPPVFDGPEDRNGRRNHDEIRLWSEYLSGSSWIVDDAGVAGGLAPDASFVVIGDHNADPQDGDSRAGAIDQLLAHPRIDASVIPSSAGAVKSAEAQGGANAAHRGDPAHDTADFDDRGSGNLRVDYVLPARGLSIDGGGVFWPAPDDPHAALLAASDHRMVWLDLRISPR